jgi:tetratricopeptide (TPR) repeat protein
MSDQTRHHQTLRYLGGGLRQTYLAGDLYLSGKLHDVVRQNPTHTQSGAHLIWLQRGDELMQGQRHREALLCYEKAIEVNAENYFIWFKKGMALEGLRQYDEAIAIYHQVAEMTPDDYLVWFKLGKACESLQRHDEALAAYDKVVELQPANHWARNDQGRMLECLGRNEEALAAYHQALALKSDFWMAMEGHRRTAIKVSAQKSRAARPQSNDVANWLRHGMDMEEAQQYEAAIAAYSQVVQVFPENHQVWLKRGELLEKLNCYEDALAAYEQVVLLQPDSHEAWCIRAQVLETLERYEEAMLSYKRATRIKADYQPAVEGLRQTTHWIHHHSRSKTLQVLETAA